MDLKKIKEIVPEVFHAELDNLSNQVQELQYNNKLLSNQVLQYEERVKDLNRRIDVLIRQTDEWVKSYDRLLKDFIQFRTTQKTKD